MPPDPGIESQRRLQRALELGYRYLARARSVAEVRRYLRGRGIAEPELDQALAELGRQGYLDDARYARALVEDRRTLDGWGSERIRARLLAAGIAPEVIERAVGQDGDGELEAAIEVLVRRIKSPPTDDRARQRALGLLVRKGYDADLAYEAVRRFERAA